MKKTNKLFKIIFSGIFAAFILFFSCEIGLGPAVDTQPPSITIDKPEVDMVIRKKFIMSGDWSDDGTITRVFVTLKRTDGKPLDGTHLERTIEGTFEKSLEKKDFGTWKAEIDPLEEGNLIIDGTYQATVSIKDKGNHTTSQSTTFTIDNTEPVLILTKPNSVPNDKTISGYGQRLFLEGSVADSTKDTWIEISFYSDESCSPESLLTTLETGYISPTDVNSNNARLASFDTDLDKEFAREYNAIYGSVTKDGPRTIYSTITVYDTAETCTEEETTQETGKDGKIKGNASKTFYISKILAESVTKSQSAGGYGLAPIDIYNVMNGTYVLKNESRAADAKSIKEKLTSDELRNETAVFTINPENSPYFTVSGLKTLNLDGKDFVEGNTIVNGTQTLEVSVFMGSDSIAIKDDDDFYVYLLECDDYGKPKSEDKEENRIKLYSKYKEEGSGSEKKTYYKVGGKTDHKTTSGAYVFSIPMNKSLKADPDLGLEGFVDIPLEYGHSYIILVNGKDTEGNVIETTDNGYGFCFTAGGTAPRISVTEPEDNLFVKKGDGLKVKGTVTSEEGEPRVTITNGSLTVDVPVTKTDDTKYSFEKDFTAEELGFDQTQSVVYSLVFKATRDATEATQPKSVWYDIKGPVITMGDPSPIVKTGAIKADNTAVTKDSVNGIISFAGTIIDEFDSRFGAATYKVEQGGVQVDKPGLSGNLEKNFNFTIDTKLLTDKQDAVIVITASDGSGNITEGRYTYYVDQSTDIPRIYTTEADKDISENATLDYVQGGNNLYVRGGNLVLSLSDDDGVANARVKIQEYNSGSFIDLDNNQNIEYPSPSVIMHTLPNSVGIYRATITVYDKVYESDDPTATTYTPDNFKQIQFFLRVVGTGPDVSITPEKEYIKTGGTYTLTIDITDEGNKPYIIKRGNATEVLDIVNDVNVDSYKYKFIPTSTEAVKFSVLDKNSSLTEKLFTPKFDDTAPSVEITEWPQDTNSTGEDSYLFKGTTSDLGSGVDKVLIQFIDEENNKQTEWKECSIGARNWNYEAVWSGTNASDDFKQVFAAENTKTVKVKAIDGADNETSVQKTFVYDKQAPVVSAVLKDPLTNTETDIINGESKVRVDITITDTNPKKVEVKLYRPNGQPVLGENGTKTITVFNGSGNVKTATTTISQNSFSGDGIYTIKITGFDDNERSSTTVTKTIRHDARIPDVTIESPDSDIDWSNAHTGNSYTFKVKAEDIAGSGVQTISYALVQQNTPPVLNNSAWETKPFTGGEKYIEMNSLAEGQWYFYVYATDKAGNNIENNPNKIQKRLLSVDKAPPTLTITSPTNLIEGKQNIICDEVGATGFEIKGTLSDNNSLATSDALVIKVGGVTKKTLTAANLASSNPSNSWSYIIPKGTAAGFLMENTSVEVEIIAKDITEKADNTVTKKYILYYDTLPPELTVSVPAQNEPISNQSLAIKGTVSDNGYGIDKLEYALYSGTVTSGTGTPVTSGGKEVNSTNFPITITGEQWYITDTTTNMPLGATEGALTLKVTATEKKNEPVTVDDRTNITTVYVPFYYDKANPNLTETEVNTTGLTTNAGFAFKGKVWDSNELDYIEITDGTTIWTSKNPAPAGRTYTSAISVTKRTSDPGDGQTNWSANFKVGSEATSYPKINDGTNDFTITAYDITGKTKQLSRTVTVDTKKPTVGTVTVNQTGGETIGSNVWYKTTSIPVTVSVSDPAYSAGISKVEYATQSGDNVDWAPLSSNGTNYTGTINFSGNGSQVLRLKVTDAVGNISDEKSVPVYIDTSAPDLSALFYKKGSAAATTLASAVYLKTGTEITVYGNYKDEQSGIENLTFKIGDTDVTPTITYSTTEIGNSAPTDSNYSIASTALSGKETSIKSWKAVITPEASGQFTVTGKNRTKNPTSEKTIFTIAVDGTAPTVTIENPSEDIEWAKALTDKTYTFKVNTTDGQGTGTAKIYYAFKSTNTAPSSDSEWTQEDASDGDKYIPNTFAAEGEYYFFVKAEDKAGNVSAVEPRKVSIDTGAPTLTVTNALDETHTNVLSGEVTTNGYTISGTLTDTNKLATSDALVIKVGGVTKKTMTAANFASSNSWSYIIPKGTAAGFLMDNTSVEVEIIAKDITGKANNTVTKKYILYYDTLPPELTVSAPAQNEPVETASKAIKGTVSDNGYGVDKVEYVLYSGTITSGSGTAVTSGGKEVNSTNFPVTITGEQWSITDTTTNMPLGTTEGALTLKVTATEKENAAGTQGGRTTTVYVPFYYDKANPNLTETEVNTTTLTTNAGFAFKGKVWDTNGLDYIEITDGTTIWTSKNPAPAGRTYTSAISVTKRTSDPGDGQTNWSANFKVGSEATSYPKINDGTNDFTITAYDITGKTKQLTRSVVVDTTNPVIGTPAITTTSEATIDGSKWYKTRSLAITVTATDTNGSGISKVEYFTSTDGTNWSSGIPLSAGANNTYSGTVSFAADGKNLKFKVCATDVAGNSKTGSNVTVNIDTTAPNLTVTQNTNLYVQSGSSVTVTGNYKDEQSGVNELTFKIGDTPITPTVTYSTATQTDVSYDTANLDKSQIVSWKAVFTPTISGKFSVQGQNRAGDFTTEVKAFDITIDSEEPVNSNVKLEENKDDVLKDAYQKSENLYYVNNTDKSFKISGVSSDDTGIKSVTIEVTNTADSSKKLTPANGGTPGKWNFAIAKDDIKTWTGGATAVVTVTDKSGRDVSETLNIVFDVTPPSPEHQIDDSVKDLVFRIGDYANDEGNEDVGGKYSHGTYGSALTMLLRGNFPDEEGGSGINKFYYKVFDKDIRIRESLTYNEDEDPIDGTGNEDGFKFFKSLDALKKYVLANQPKTFSPLAQTETRTVEYNIKPTGIPASAENTIDRLGGGTLTNGYNLTNKGYVQFSKSITSNYKTNITGFAEGENFFVIIAEDNAGNTAVDSAEVPTPEDPTVTEIYPCYSLNVDLMAPTIPQKHEGSVFTNKIYSDKTSETVTISGTVSDKPKQDAKGSSGIKEIVFSSDQAPLDDKGKEVTVKISGDALTTTGLTAAQLAENPTLKKWTVNVRPLLSTDGTAIISARVTDNAGFVTSVPVANITVDRTPPTVRINSPAADSKVAKEFTISGTASDGNGAGVNTSKKMSLYYTTNSTAGAAAPTSAPADNANASTGWKTLTSNITAGESWSYSADLTDLISNGNNIDVYFSLSATDASGTEGNTGYSAPHKVVVDRKAPTSGTPTITSSGNTVSGKTWYKSSFINIKVENVKDEGGTGISQVEYSTDDTNWYPMSGSGTTYTATANCANQGANTIKVRLTDVAGNQSIAGSIIAYVDTKEPSLENSWAKYLSGDYEAVSELLINGDNGYEIKISAKDEDGGTGTNAGNNSGIASVQYSYGSHTINGTKYGDDWIITVPKTGDGTNNYSSTGSNKIYVIIKDNAGNEIRERILSVTKDITVPTVEIKSYTRAGSKTTVSGVDLDDVNGTITISGLADDTNKFSSVKLEYQKDGESTWSTITTSSQTSWTTTLNTKSLTDKKKYTIKATATDAAGNTATDSKVVYVNQDSDRPVITVTNMVIATVANETSYLKKTSKLEGTISDDDGNVSKLEYSANGSTWTEVNLEYGTAWSIADLPEGENKLYFRVTDSVNATPFTTALENASATTESSNQPKIKDSSNTYVTHTQGSLALKFKVVTKQPDVDEKQYQVYNSSSNSWETRDNLGILGGIYTKFKISLKAKSNAFIANVKAKYTTDSYDINFTTNEVTTNNNYHTWTTGEIALDATKTEIKIKISDASSTTDPMTLEQTITYSVDNTAPTIKIKEPSSTVGVKETMQFDMSEAATAYYAVTRKYKLNDQGVETTTECTAEDVAEWTLIQDTSNGLTRYVFFDDDVNETDHTERFAIYLTEDYLNITTKAEISKPTNPYETITPVKFWVKAVDSCGNTATKDQLVNVDPQGNRPTVTLGYPVDVLKDGAYVAPTLGGTIRLDGNVSDDIAAKYVWVKIEREGAAFSGADVKFLKGKQYPIGDMTTNELLENSVISALADNASVPDYAIRVPVTGTSWNLSINGTQEFNKDNAEAHLKFRIYATDSDQDKVDPNIKHIHRSAEITQNIVIDSRTPYISASDLRLVKYNGNDVAASKEYKDGTSVQEIWYLVGKIKDDDSGIRTISFKRNSDTAYTNVITAAGQEQTNYDNDSHFYFTTIPHSEDATKFDYNFSIPLGNKTAGQVGTDTITIKAVEATTQDLQVEQTYTVTYDNMAPVFNTDTENAFVKLSTNIYNSSGFYTFGAIASEDKVTVGEVDVSQSGVERIAFYFTRDLDYSLSSLDSATYTEHTGEKDSKTNDLFDVMIYHSNGDAADVSTGNMIVNYKGKTDDSLLSYSEGLYWRTHSGSASGSSFTYTGNVDPNIHAGGLVKINGVIYTIASVSDKTVTVSSNIGTATSAAFALCNVIDKSGEKNGTSIQSDHGYGYGYYPTRTTDDGDLITETFNNQGTEWIFDASINSKNLPDGPITLHMVAFDKAGNVTAPFTMSGTVKNNAPRIAGLILGTDENGNGSVDEGEFIKSYTNKFNKGYDDSMNEMHDVSFPIKVTGQAQTSLLTVKGLTVVKPEIIGGNGAISYSYEVYPYNASDGTWPDTTEITNAGGSLKDASGTGISGTTDDVVTGQITLPVSDFIGKSNGSDTGAIPDGTLSKFLFKFGDSTPGLTDDDETGKNTATMAVYMDVALRETNKAKNWILPFYWNSKTDNSLFKQSADEGHIELAPDWVLVDSYASGNAEYDADPKVSGRIKIEGIAQDDTLLSAIYVKFGKKIGGDGGFTANTDKAIATYNAAGASWTVTALTNGAINTTTGWASAIQQATYQELLDAGIIDALPDNTEATAKVPYTSQDYGHVVHWILYLDTAQIDGVAATNVTVTATAADRGKPKWNGSGVGYTPNATDVTVTDNNDSFSGAVTKNGTEVSVADLTGKYRVDVVPYITRLYTGISDSAGEEFARSATGKYIIRESETIKMYGFNLKVGDNAVKVSYATETPTTITPTAGGSGYVNLPIGDSANSGSVTITVNSIESLNNKNNNPIFTSTTDDTITAYAYNSQADGVTNNRLTDDVELWIWKTSAFDNVVNTTNITSPMMKMDNSGNYYISYGNGSNLFAIDKNGASTNLEICYNKYHNTNVAFDSSGNFYGVATNTDRIGTSRNAATSFTFFARALGQMNEGTGYSGKNNTWAGNNNYGPKGNYYNGTNKRRLELSQYGGDNGTYNINRVQRPKMTILGAGTASDSAKVYLAYYDASANNLKFRYGEVTGNNAFTGGLANNLTGNGTGSSSASGYHVVADSATDTVFKSGAYTAIGYTTDGKAVIAWYDANARRLVYSYNNTPGTEVTSMTDNPWQTNAVYLDDMYTGWYVDLVVDKGNHVHIAYYNSKSGDLKYVYIPDYEAVSRDENTGDLSGATVVTVDSYLSVGTNITIDVRDEGTDETNEQTNETTHNAKYVPYIYYYNTSNNQTMNSNKVAWRKDFTTLRDGAINDKFTGAWESMTIPTDNIPLDATVCGGVPTSNDYKDTVVLGYMTDVFYEKAYIKGNIK